MWRLWDTDSQEEQWDSYNEAGGGIPVLASKSKGSVIFIAERPLQSIQRPGMIMRATEVLPTFQAHAVTHPHPLVSL